MSTQHATPPPQSGLSALFSLSDAAATAHPIPLSTSSASTPHTSLTPLQAAANDVTGSLGVNGVRAREPPHKDLASGKNDVNAHALKHRRLSSTSQVRRRMSDAREAVAIAGVRPSSASYSSSSALDALSSLSLGHSPSVSGLHNLHSHSPALERGRSNPASHEPQPASFTQPINIGSSANLEANGPYSKDHSLNRSLGNGLPLGSVPFGSISSSLGEDVEEEDEFEGERMSVAPDNNGISSGKKRRALKVKKRGTIFQCESCSKVYRHPSCLVKHRWEHSPHWREASKFMYSKHQQVQLLEAATILSHLDPGSSLPEDRSHWPSYLSNGLLPPPSEANKLAMNPSLTTVSSSSHHSSSSFKARQTTSISSSVPNGTTVSRMSRTPSSGKMPAGGPRMSTFSIPSTAQSVTQVKPGLLAHATSTSPMPSSIPMQLNTFPPTQTLSNIMSGSSNGNGKATKVFAGAGMTISPYADEELASADEASDSGDEVDGIKVEPVDAPMSGFAKVQPMSTFPSSTTSNSNGFNDYRDPHNNGGAYSVGSSSGPLAFEANGASANTTSGLSGWSSSLPRSDMREDSLSASGRSRSIDEEEEASSRFRSRSKSAEYGGRAYEKFDGYRYENNEGDMDVEYERGGVRVGKGVRKERERDGEEDEEWVAMDMDM